MVGCTGVPEGVAPVADLELNRYLGTWYEIARLDHGFERGLSSVTATYSLREDGGVRVLNQGYRADEDRWVSAEGRAYFVDDTQTAHFKVSFFGPFYSSYIVFGLDDVDYQYAFVSGYTQDYLWLLARTPTVAPEVFEAFEARASALGFPVQELIMVDQGVVNPALGEP
jgi:apolipoprotein D and lipocalin family protein